MVFKALIHHITYLGGQCREKTWLVERTYQSVARPGPYAAGHSVPAGSPEPTAAVAVGSAGAAAVAAVASVEATLHKCLLIAAVLEACSVQRL